jgi:hypothetical protein
MPTSIDPTHAEMSPRTACGPKYVQPTDWAVDAVPTVCLTVSEWRRAPPDSKACEAGHRYLLVDLDGVRRIARVTLSSSR